MTRIEPLIPGIYARSQTLVQTTRDHDRDRVSDDELAQAQRRDIETLIGVQAAHGYTTINPGLLTWQDLFRPFTTIIDELEPEALTRFIDTNTFYRRPDLDGQPSLTAENLGTFAAQHIPTTGPLDTLGTLPSPTAWITAAQDEDDTYPNPQTAHTIADTVYPDLLTLYESLGYTTIVLSDPWLGTYPDPGQVLESLDTLSEHDPTELELLVQLPFQNAHPLLDDVANHALDGVLVDLTQTPLEALTTLPTDTTIGLGLVDARQSLIERDDLLLSAVDRALTTLNAERYVLTPTGDLQHVPEPIAREKTRTLGHAAHTIETKQGGTPQ